jgi:hypothetical protein
VFENSETENRRERKRGPESRENVVKPLSRCRQESRFGEHRDDVIL